MAAVASPPEPRLGHAEAPDVLSRATIPCRSQLTGMEITERSRDRGLNSPSMVPVDPRSSSGQSQEDTATVARVPTAANQPCPAESHDNTGHRAGMQMQRGGKSARRE